MWTNAAEVGGRAGRRRRRQRQIDDVRGWDFFDDDNDPSDFDGHGTGTASIIAARGDNGTGMTGIAPNARVMILRAGNSTISVSAAVQAVAYARANGARVVNMSFGSTRESAALRDAIVATPGLVFVTASGNDGANVDTTPAFPCATAAPNLVCVGATTSSDTLAAFSNRGAVNVDLAAPGQFIRNLDPAVRHLFGDSFSPTSRAAGRRPDLWGRQQVSAGPPADFELADTPGGDYANSSDTTAQRVGTFDTSGAVRECQVSFSLGLHTAGPGDTLRVQRSTDGVTLTTLRSFTGNGDLVPGRHAPARPRRAPASASASSATPPAPPTAR